MEVFHGGSLESVATGYIRTMSALGEVPEAITLMWSSESDGQKMLQVAMDVYGMGTEVFWSNLELWNKSR